MAIDHIVSNVVITSSGPYLPGVGDLSLTFDVENIGTTNSGSIRQGIYLSTDDVYDASDIYLSSEYLSSLAAMTSFSDSESREIPNDVPNGDYYVIVHADYNNARAESDETNNWSSSSSTITISNNPAFYADVGVSNFQITSTDFQDGDVVSFTFDYFNYGTVDANDYEFDLRTSIDSYLNDADDNDEVLEIDVAAGTGGTYTGTFIINADDPYEIGDTFFQIVGNEGENYPDGNP